ncbi:MAG: hypothetical protein ACXU7D_02315 [Burkholderiaceae bacterium]
MDDLTKILLTSSLTALGAVFVFVVSQLLGKLVIEPIQDLKKVLGEIRYALVFHAQAISTPVGNFDMEVEAAKVLRKLACELQSKIASVPCYDYWAARAKGFLPTRESAMEASKQLIGLSNSVHQPDRSDKNVARVSKVEQLLGYESIDE